MYIKFMLPILTEDQIQMKVITAGLFEWSIREPDFLSKIITGVESLSMILR